MKPIIVIISGLSGSGKTVALRALEDSGFFCADNLPVTLIDSFVSIVSKNTDTKKIGIGVDIREKGFLSGIDEVLKALGKTTGQRFFFSRRKKRSLSGGLKRPADLIRSVALLKSQSGSKRNELHC